MGELDIINNVYLREIESLYTWKILILECPRSGLYFDTLVNTLVDILVNTLVDILSGTSN